MLYKHWTLHPLGAANHFTPTLDEVSDAIMRLDGIRFPTLGLILWANDVSVEEIRIVGGINDNLWVRWQGSDPITSRPDLNRRKVLLNRARWDDLDLLEIATGEGQEEMFPAFTVSAYVATTAITLYITRNTFAIPYANIEWGDFNTFSTHQGELYDR